MAWEIEWTEEAAKEFCKLNQSIQKDIRDYLVKRVLTARHPRQFGKPLKSNLAGMWRYRTKDYRIICKIHDQSSTISILRVAHRRRIYHQEKKMLEKMIIDIRLHPVRLAAIKGDLSALCELARMVAEGEQTKPCPDILDYLYHRIMEHPNYGEEPYSALAALNILSVSARLEYELGTMSEQEAIETTRQVIIERTKYYTTLPYEQWDLDILQHSMEWLKIHEGEEETQSPRN